MAAFYYPGSDEPWDVIYQCRFLANFYSCNITLTINGITASFLCAEAAFQATKWWNDPAIRAQFEAADGNGAYYIKSGLDNPDNSYAGLGRDGAMKEILIEKFSDSDLQKGLLLTEDAYLLEHNAKPKRDYYWSDNHDGKGANMLGKTLMQVREHYKGSPAPTGNYTVADFTNYAETPIQTNIVE